MNRISKGIGEKVAQYVLFSLVILLVVLSYLYNEIPKIIFVEEYTFLSLMSDFQCGRCFPYILILLISMPMLLNGFNIETVSSRMDYLIIQRISIIDFYKREKLKSFMRGFVFGVAINIAVIVTIWIVHPSSGVKLVSSVTNNTLTQVNNPIIEFLLSVFLQSIGMGIANVCLFMLTRLRPNKYLYYLSLLLGTVAVSTGIVVVFALVTMIFPFFNEIVPFVIPLFSIINPLTLLFPNYDLFMLPFSNIFNFLASLIVYLVLIRWISKELIQLERMGRI